MSKVYQESLPVEQRTTVDIYNPGDFSKNGNEYACILDMPLPPPPPPNVGPGPGIITPDMDTDHSMESMQPYVYRGTGTSTSGYKSSTDGYESSQRSLDDAHRYFELDPQGTGRVTT